jgi:hypothetical protein
MGSLAIDPKRWLIGEITGKAAWYRRMASVFPNDQYCSRCSHTLKRLALAVKALPDTHRLFTMLEQINHVDAYLHARWLDELCLEFSHTKWHSLECTRRAIRDLMEITDDYLWEWQKANRLH